MKNMKRVFLYLGMGSCVSTKSDKLPHNPTPMEKTSSVVITSVQPSIWKVAGATTPSKDEQFFDSKAWLESDDEDFLSMNGDNSPPKQGYNNVDHKGRRLSDLFKDSSSFNTDSQTSLKAMEMCSEEKPKSLTTNNNNKLVKEKSVKRCLPSLVRTLSCGDRKKRPSNVAIAVAG